MILLAVLTVLLITIILTIYYCWCFTYWRRNGVPSPFTCSPVGSIGNPLNPKYNSAVTIKRYYDRYKRKGCKYVGIYILTSPVFIPIDLDVIKSILKDDFNYFPSRGVNINPDDPLAGHLVNQKGEEWKEMRAKLTPTFSPIKLKTMFPTIMECANELVTFINAQNNKRIDIHEMASCYTTDVLCSCVFGIQSHTLGNKDSIFRTFGRKLFQPTKTRVLTKFLLRMNPKLQTLFNIKESENAVMDFFLTVFKEVVKSREIAEIKRKDFVQSLVDMNSLDFMQMATQAFGFFKGGFETAAAVITFCCYELARNEEIQSRLRTEILKIIGVHGEVTFDGIMEMEYLDQVLCETMRKHPPIAAIFRKCEKDYFLDGKTARIPKGTTVLIDPLAVHHDEEYYPNPDTFDPGRFSYENRSKRSKYTFLSLGEGPKFCIGSRFAYLEMKIFMCQLLQYYRILPDKSIRYPIVYNPKTHVLIPDQKVYILLEKI